MKKVNRFKSIAVMMLALGILFSAALTSCGGKKEETTEQAEGEHPAEGAEGAEHPASGGEHPAADSTAKDSTSAQ